MRLDYPEADSSPRHRHGGGLRPARTVFIAFALVAAAGTAVLMLPVARNGPGGASLMEAVRKVEAFSQRL